MKKIDLFFKFNKYSFIELAWTLISLISDMIVIFYWWNNLFIIPHIIYLSIALFFTGFGVYRTYESFSTYKLRLEDYTRISEMFDKYGVKKSVLYHLQEVPCSATVTEQLVKDYNIKDIEIYTDKL